jgi:hypothetical protein
MLSRHRMIDQSQYLKERIDDQIAWYGRKSRQNKLWYRRLRIISIIISLSIPILVGLIGKNYDDEQLKICIAVAGALVALIEGLLSLNKYQDLWSGYRATGEGLKYHRYLFEAAAAPYDVPNAFQLFVQNAEGMMATERANWIQVAAQKPAAETASEGQAVEQ